MKISKSLLKAIALGVTIGAVATSCTKDVYMDEMEVNTTENEGGVHDIPVTQGEEEDDKCWDCPACGLG